MVRDVGQTGARGGLVRDFSGEMVVYGNMRRLVLCCGRWALAQAQDGPGREAPRYPAHRFHVQKVQATPRTKPRWGPETLDWAGACFGLRFGAGHHWTTVTKSQRAQEVVSRKKGGFSGKGDTSTRQEQSLCLMCAGS